MSGITRPPRPRPRPRPQFRVLWMLQSRASAVELRAKRTKLGGEREGRGQGIGSGRRLLRRRRPRRRKKSRCLDRKRAWMSRNSAHIRPVPCKYPPHHSTARRLRRPSPRQGLSLLHRSQFNRLEALGAFLAAVKHDRSQTGQARSSASCVLAWLFGCLIGCLLRRPPFFP
ncbi:hypothetical protein B0T19DRAFT_127918 [Cercophora scortea]|uniref:Uncharacterized protein n=1 Tax=Cercophora scortea TaxID=314031 RepID=A0AAE0IYQ4_9PEZI|nr:hypothetical protein B0T19DRAFT_127918 [Cercophora scortea]